jgi:hypothetical protein
MSWPFCKGGNNTQLLHGAAIFSTQPTKSCIQSCAHDSLADKQAYNVSEHSFHVIIDSIVTYGGFHPWRQVAYERKSEEDSKKNTRQARSRTTRMVLVQSPDEVHMADPEKLDTAGTNIVFRPLGRSAGRVDSDVMHTGRLR